MATRKDTLFERFLAPIVRLLINEDELRQFSDSVDWEQAGDRFRNPDLTYPHYYSSQNFHGIERGYLNPGASVSYDPITQYALLPNETWVRQSLINAVQGKPRRILDLGCGTGSTTVMLKQAFPEAETIGLDLSPYMLFMGDRKAKQAGLEIQWHHGKAEETAFPDASFDLVTASLLFHETPVPISQAILREAFRLLKPNGEVVILDGRQKTIKEQEWLQNLFEEPYLRAYGMGNVDAWMGAAGFEAVETEDVLWVQQVTRGMKPLPVEGLSTMSFTQQYDNWEGDPIPAF